MRKSIKLMILAFSLAFILSSCSQRIIDFTLISTKNFDVTRMKEYKVQKTRAMSEEKVHIILLYISKTTQQGQLIKQAIDNTIESIPGCVGLANGVVSVKQLYFVLYGSISIEVEGDPIIDPTIASNYVKGDKYFVVNIDENNAETVKEVSSLDYNILKSGE